MRTRNVIFILEVLIAGMVALLSVGYAFGWKLSRRALNREMIEGPGATIELIEACDRLGLEECEMKRATYRSELEECEWRLKQRIDRSQSLERMVVEQIKSIDYLDTEWEECMAACPDYSDHACQCCKWERKWGPSCTMLQKECEAFYERMEEP